MHFHEKALDVLLRRNERGKGTQADKKQYEGITREVDMKEREREREQTYK
jgi:hypothetical protein